jgi:hypothetical protein
VHNLKSLVDLARTLSNPLSQPKMEKPAWR